MTNRYDKHNWHLNTVIKAAIKANLYVHTLAELHCFQRFPIPMK